MPFPSLEKASVKPFPQQVGLCCGEHMGMSYNLFPTPPTWSKRGHCWDLHHKNLGVSWSNPMKLNSVGSPRLQLPGAGLSSQASLPLAAHRSWLWLSAFTSLSRFWSGILPGNLSSLNELGKPFIFQSVYPLLVLRIGVMTSELFACQNQDQKSSKFIYMHFSISKLLWVVGNLLHLKEDRLPFITDVDLLISKNLVTCKFMTKKILVFWVPYFIGDVFLLRSSLWRLKQIGWNSLPSVNHHSCIYQIFMKDRQWAEHCIRSCRYHKK